LPAFWTVSREGSLAGFSSETPSLVPSVVSLGTPAVSLAVSLGTPAIPSTVPIVVLLDTEQENLSKPIRSVISRIDSALDNCRKVLDHSRKFGLPVAFIRMFHEVTIFFQPRNAVRPLDRRL